MQPSNLPENILRLMEQALLEGQSAIRIRAAPSAPGLAPHASKFGGRPFTPAGFVWPINPQRRPMHFIGQINFAEAAAQVPSVKESLPSRGLFQFFFVSQDELSEGVGVDDQRYVRFFWYPHPEALKGAATGPVHSHLEREFQLGFCEFTSLPDGTRLALHDTGDRSEELGAYQREWVDRGRPRHQLLGYPWGIQYDPRESTQRGNPRSGSSWLVWNRVRKESALEEYRRKLDEWQLLWQIDSDGEAGLEWMDSGTVYILVRREALRNGDLSTARLDFQCF